MLALSALLDEVRKRIALYQGSGVNEQNTKTALIDPVLRQLGWEVGNLEEVMQEYKRKPQDKPVDYAMFLLRTPKLFVEAKALGQSLDDRKWANQIMGYAAVAGVKWVVITNGDEYRVYNSCVDVPVEEKLFRLVRVTECSTPVLETLGLLSKSGIGDNEIDALWKAHFVDRQVRVALEGLFSPEPDSALMRAVKRHVRDLRPKDIRASLSRVRAHFDFPVEPGPRPAGDGQERLTDVPRGGLRGKRGTPKMLGVTLLDLINAGLLKPPVKLTARYKGRQMDAHLLPDGDVTFQGERYSSCSMAGGAAKSAATGRKTGTADGWKFWRYRDESGNLVPLDNARRKHLKQKTK